MTKTDFKKTDRRFYSGKPGVIVETTVPPMTYLMIDGKGAPEGPAYAAALAALYPLSYAIKFAMKARGADHVVGPLEALWWADDPSAFTEGRRDEWRWTAMIRQLDTVTESDLTAARNAKGVTADVRLEILTEGRALQAMHHGPFADEAPLLHRLHHHEMPARGLTFNGPHHEIYLSDFRRTAPEKLRTVLRQPVRAL